MELILFPFLEELFTTYRALGAARGGCLESGALPSQP